jgi:hypothetical protein
MQLIDRIIKLLQEDGWIKGKARSPEGWCLMGAMQEAWLDTGGVEEELRVAVRAIRSLTETPDLTYWNDFIARDADHVLEVLKLAGEKADERSPLCS